MTRHVRHRPLATAAVAALALTLPVGAASAAPVELGTPLPSAHAHNDYEHTRPLFDALSHGFTSVEADVWLVAGQLFIGHDAPDPKRTLKSDYLAPLAEVVRKNRSAVYRGYEGRFRLYIDVKSGPETWPVIEKQLAEYPGLVTTWKNGRRSGGAVEVVISGNRDLAAMEAAQVRRSAYDAASPTSTPGSLRSS